MRPWTRRLVAIAAMLAGTVAVGMLTLFFLHRTGFIKGLVNRSLEGSMAPFQAYVDDAWIDLWSASVEIKDLQILHEKSSTPIARLDRASIDLWLNPFRGPLLHIKRVTVESGSINLPYSILQSLESKKGRGGDLVLPEIWIRRMSARIEPALNRRLSIGDLSLAFSPLSEGGGLLRGRISLPVGPELLLSGRVDEKGAGSFVVAGDLHFEPRNTPETEGPQNLWAELRPVGDLSLRVQGSFGEGTPGGFRLQADGVAKDLMCSIPGTPFRIQKLQGAFTLGNLKAESRVDLQGVWEDTLLYLNGKASFDPSGQSAFDLFAAAQNLPMDERTRRYATLDRTVAQVWEALDPKGRCDLSLRLHKQTGSPDIVAEPFLRLRGAELTFHGFSEADGADRTGFPLPITDLRGEVLCQPGKIGLHQLRGKLHGADLAISGTLFQEVSHPRGEKIGIDLQLDLSSLPLDATTRRAAESLPKEVAATWDLLHLGGAADLNLRLTKAPGPEALRLSGRIAPKAATARLRDFPFPLDGIEGEIFLDPERFAGRVQAKAGTGAVDVEVALLHLRGAAESSPPPLLVRLAARKVPIDEKLREAVAVLLPGAVETARPHSGLLDANVSLARVSGEFDRSVRVGFDQVSLEPMWFPLPLESGSGSLLYESSGDSEGRLSIQGVEARALGAPAFFHYAASLLPGEAPPSFEIWLRACEMPLVPDLFRAMEKAKLLGSGAWGKAHWSGTVAVGWDQKKNRDLAASSRLTATFQDAGLRLPEQGFEMQGITGKLETREQGLFAEQFSAKLGNTAIDLRNIRCPQPSEFPQIDFLLSVSRLDLAQDLDRALPPSIASRAKAFGVRGIAAAEEIAVRVSLPPASAPSIEIQGPLILRGFGTQGGIAVEDANATLWIQEGKLEGERLLLRGLLRDGSATLFRRRLENLQTRFEVSDHAFRIFDASGEAYQGKIAQGPESDLIRVDLLPPYAFRLDLRFADLNLRRLLRDLLPSAKDLRGSLGVDLQLNGEYADLRKVQGQGEVRIRDGALWEVPVLQQVFKALTLKSPPVFTEGRFSFRIGDQKISLAALEEGATPFELESGVMTVTAQKGSLDFTGNLDLDLRIKSFSGIPIFGDLLGFFLSLADFHLTGPIGNPQVAGSASGETPRKLVFVPGMVKDERNVRF